jgi:two-component system sensor histidine kinase GlrK
MKIGRPRTLLGLVLLGMGLVTLPLLVAVGNAVVKLEQLADSSETVVSQSQTATLENQRVQSLLADMERHALQHIVLPDRNLLTLYDDEQTSFEQSLAALSSLPQQNPVISEHLERVYAVSKQVERAVRNASSDDVLTGIISESFRVMNGAAREVSQGMRLLTNEQLNALQESTRSAQRALAWQSAALAPGTLVLVLFFLLLVGRPMRQVDRAIRDLGEGDFSNPIAVSGPRDIETLGRQLEWLRHRLKESTDEKNKFLRHMSHELKTPLANIREGTELLLDGSVGQLDHQQQEVTGILRDNGVKLQKLIENLLTFSAWQTKTASLELTDFELKPMVFSVLSQHRLVISNKKLKLQLSVSPIRIRADEGKLRLVLENLISNAIKFTPQGGAIHVGAAMQGGDLVIDVADSGPGVDPEDGERIFEAFYQGRRLQGGPVGGTGIGLSVVAECVLAHGGSVALVPYGAAEGPRYETGTDAGGDRGAGPRGALSVGLSTGWPRTEPFPEGAHFQVRLPLRRASDKPALTVVNA